MFTETHGSRKQIGDVDVVYHNGLYHLFHLVLPNHDFIAHAVSTNAINWRRVGNALFIGDPGSWDDLMLWTMHVTPDPHRPGSWRMFYTGLSRREQGRMQRVGLALSDDLYHWKKAPVHWEDLRGPTDPEPVLEARRRSQSVEASFYNAPFDPESCFPIEPDTPHYENDIDVGRSWVSFRDPFYFQEDGQGWLAVAGRVPDGPIIRRGCVAALRETEPNCFESVPALHHPGLYDDLEVPNVVQLDGEYYLIASIREDSKIRYWHTDRIGNPWRSYHDNVLMAQGNYAARVCRDDQGWLVWNFFTMKGDGDQEYNLMPPPKRLMRNENGLLRTATFEGLTTWRDEAEPVKKIRALKELPDGGRQQAEAHNGLLDLRSDAGFEAFVLDGMHDNFWLEAGLSLQGHGKCGLVFRIDPQTHDGYYLSLDLLKGIAQL
ncbi:MAG: glycosyl hydrolase, partial [Phycisphaeraceae bacterium]|nr:glycosyl hydrolase [Phycisphaeraceae bacterium]